MNTDWKEEIDAMVRDFTQIPAPAKSEVRRRILALLTTQHAELAGKITDKAREKRAILMQEGIVDAPILFEHEEVLALLQEPTKEV